MQKFPQFMISNTIYVIALIIYLPVNKCVYVYLIYLNKLRQTENAYSAGY